VCFCIGFAGVGVFLVRGGFLSKRELPCFWCMEGVQGRNGAQAEELLSCSSPAVWSNVYCLSWQRSPVELLRFSPMKGGFNQVVKAIYLFFSL